MINKKFINKVNYLTYFNKKYQIIINDKKKAPQRIYDYLS